MDPLNCKFCTLRLIADKKVERCPQERCSFWESGGAVLRGGCMIDRLGIDMRRRDLAAYLLELRDSLDEARERPGSEVKGATT